MTLVPLIALIWSTDSSEGLVKHQSKVDEHVKPTLPLESVCFPRLPIVMPSLVTSTAPALLAVIQSCWVQIGLCTVGLAEPGVQRMPCAESASCFTKAKPLKGAPLQLASSYNNVLGDWQGKNPCSIYLLDVDKIISSNLSHPACNVNDLSIWPFAAEHKGIEGSSSSHAMLSFSRANDPIADIRTKCRP